MRRRLKRIGIALLATLSICMTGAWWLVRQSRQVPEFYAKATRNSPIDTDAQNLRLQEDVKKLRQDAAQHGSWNACFTDRQINAWLIRSCQRSFRNCWPKE